MDKIKILVLVFCLLGGFCSKSQIATKASVHDYAVIWNEPGVDYRSSMPIGNGDLGLNLWTEANGDVVFLIGKTDAWTENGQLVKLGRVRLRFSKSPFLNTAFFKQILHPTIGEILINGENGSTLRVWVDINAPVIHLEMESGTEISMEAKLEIWRTKPRITRQGGEELFGRGSLRELSGIPSGRVVIEPDTVLAAKDDQLVWLHHNSRSIYPLVLENQHLASLLGKYPDPLLNRNFGGTIMGTGMKATDNQTLKSAHPQKKIRMDVCALTLQSDIGTWQKAMDKVVSATKHADISKAKLATEKWWKNFWDRSWIKVSGDESAKNVTQGYAMQRWMCGASGRGEMPIKYNGGIFTVGQEPPVNKIYDSSKGQIDPDFRAWGGNLWFQNQRLLYWPMIAAGDTDLMMPFINLYKKALPLATERTKIYFNHDGASFSETIYFWGLPNNSDFGWDNKENIIRNTWIRHYVTGGLELTAMMLDFYETHPNPLFLKNTLLPIATAVTTYYAKHWPIKNGKIWMEPSQAIETRQTTINDAPDIAGLMHVLPRLLALSEPNITPETRKMWQQIISQLPKLPKGRTDSAGKHPQLITDMSPTGKNILLAAEQFSKTMNVENPELYSVFPFRLYGINMPDLELARNTYAARRFISCTCWGQDGIQAAVLGLADSAKKEVIANFTMYGTEKFKWFWAKGHDWEPDLDNGGAGQIMLQNMLLQTSGDKLLLFPAWPKEWDVDFKLHAAGNTTIEGEFKKGRLVRLHVSPVTRKNDIVNLFNWINK